MVVNTIYYPCQLAFIASGLIALPCASCYQSYAYPCVDDFYVGVPLFYYLLCVYGRTYTLLLYWNRLLLSRGSRRRRKALLLFLFMHKAFRHKVAAGNYYYPYYLKPQTPPTPIVCWIPLDDVSNTTPFIQYTELTIGV